MSVKVLWRPEAPQDRTEIWDYLFEHDEMPQTQLQFSIRSIAAPIYSEEMNRFTNMAPEPANLL